MQFQPAEHLSDDSQIQLHPNLVRVEQLSDEIGELSGYLNAANCRLLELIAEFHELKGWVDQGANSCAHWLNWKCGLGMNAARERVRTALALADLPLIHAAFRTGRISYSKVRAMTRVATAANEDYLLDAAIHGTATHVEKLVRGYRWVTARNEENNQEHQRRDSRYCKYFWDENGCLVVSARLSPEQGAMFIKALEAGKKAVEQDDARRDAIDRAEAEAVTAVTLPYQELPQKRADALEMMAESFLASGPAASGNRHEVLLIADEAVMTGKTGAGQCCLDSGPVIGVDMMRRLTCDAAVRAVTLDGHGEPLDIGRKSRTIPPPMRRALLLRDGGCRFPGCNNTRHVDGHHIVHWACGGETKLTNLVTLCRHHHQLIHEVGFTVNRTGTNRFEFRSPRGNVIPDAAPPPTTTRRPDLGVDIDKDTSACLWDGLPNDYSAAVEVLQDRDGRAPF